MLLVMGGACGGCVSDGDGHVGSSAARVSLLVVALGLIGSRKAPPPPRGRNDEWRPAGT